MIIWKGVVREVSYWEGSLLGVMAPDASGPSGGPLLEKRVGIW